MKKIISFALTIMMVATMSVNAFAAEIDKDNGTASVPVTGTYVSGSGEDTVSVDITWGSMEFTYTAASQGSWNTESHTYDNATQAGWSAKGNTITLKNHSDVGVTAKFDFNANDNLNLTYEFKNGDTTVNQSGVNIESANDAKYQTKGEDGKYPAPTATVDFNITGGAISKSYNTEGNTLGNITITISKQK